MNLVKTGSGTQTLAGISTYTGTTTVTTGSLTVSGSLSMTSSVSVGSAGVLNVSGSLNNAALITLDGILHGRGSVGAITVDAGGQLAPGGTTTSGTLSVGGNITFSGSSAASLAIRLGQTAGVLNDQIKLGSGAYSINLNFATLNLTLGGFLDQTVGNLYTLIDGSSSSGTISGTFAQGSSITVGADTFDILYNKNGDNSGSGNDVLLRLAAVPEPNSLLILVCGAALLLAFSRRSRRRLA